MGTVVQFFTPLGAVLGGLSLPVRIAWGAWLVWAICQLAWLAWSRGDGRMRRRTTLAGQSGVRPAPVRPPSRKTVLPEGEGSTYGASDFIAALDEEQAAAGHGHSERSSAYR